MHYPLELCSFAIHDTLERYRFPRIAVYLVRENLFFLLCPFFALFSLIEW